MPKQPTSMIPLLCDLCPKKPRFSDVSHLLTHISSKSHLSNRFKLQIRSQGEPEARRLLTDFDSWYIDNGLEDLLSERLTAKEQKKSTKRSRIQSISIKPIVRKTDTKPELKIEMKAEKKYGMKAEDPIERPLASTPIYRPPIPRMHSWSTDPYVADFAAIPTGSPWALDSVYETPTMKRNIPNFSRMETPDLSSAELVKAMHAKVNDMEYDEENDGSKLKGIYWPGMNLFDSATAEMKRMRNQKKDGTALQQMKRSSAGVEPHEWVFNANGGLRKVRDIFDDSNDSSPDRVIAVSNPKKRRNGKRAMTDISVNALRNRNSAVKQPAKKAAAKRKLVVENFPKFAPKKKAHRLNFGLSKNVCFSPNVDEHEEFHLTMGDLGKRRPSGIFRDAESSPARTESPLEDHKFDFSSGPALIQTNSYNTIQHSPTPLHKPAPMRFEGKENSGPEQRTRRPMPNTSNSFHPDMFHSDSLNPLFTHSHAHAFSYRDSSNFSADKSGFHAFGDDYKPMFMSGHFSRMSESHGLPQVPGPGMADNIRYGM